MDLASVFYILGIVFFITCFLVLLLIVVTLVGIVHKVSRVRNELPVKVISYLRDNNSTQLRAFGIAIVGYILSFLRGKVQSKKKG